MKRAETQIPTYMLGKDCETLYGLVLDSVEELSTIILMQMRQRNCW